MTTASDMMANRRAIRRHIIAGLGAMILMVFGVGGWSVATDFSGAVIASGRLVVASDVKKVQHPSGGVVGELRVREGDRVRQGDVLIRLDETATRANLGIVLKSLDQFIARRARLAAERDGATEIRFPPDLTGRASDASAVEAMEGEKHLFDLRRELRQGRKSQLSERVQQLELEIGGMEKQRQARLRQLDLVAQERTRLASLYEKKLVQTSTVVAIEREQAVLDGEAGAFSAQIAQAQGKIAETRLQIIAIDQETAEQVAADLRDMDAKIGEYRERRIAAEDQLRRIDITAPQDGVVHQLAMHTVGGVVGAGEQLALVVPVDDALIVEAKIQPQDVAHIYTGQKAMMRFSAFNQRTTPELAGAVQRISADIAVDAHSGASFYTVWVRINPDEIGRLGEVKLTPGMPVETFLRTQDRSVASYFVKPLMDQIARAFRET